MLSKQRESPHRENNTRCHRMEMERGWAWVPTSVLRLLTGLSSLGACKVPLYPDEFFLLQNIWSKWLSWVA